MSGSSRETGDFHKRRERRYGAGSECLADVVSFRVWAPAHSQVRLVLDQAGDCAMQPEDGGYFRLDLDGVRPGQLYGFRLGKAEDLLADPASRFQPHGPDSWSMVVDAAGYSWQDGAWAGVEPGGQVLYEMHIGTFTPEGTYGAAASKLPLLTELGITCVELMPVNEFFGEFGWGYDGVLPYAPTRTYGTPDELKAFVDEAHRQGIAVILDVVYNHFGAGERFERFTPHYFTDRYTNEWGKSLNFDGEECAGVRDFIAENAAFWIDEYHFDGLRIDATQALFDSSDEHIVAHIARKARAAAELRPIYLIAENEPQDTRLVMAHASGGCGLDGVWNDDFHHSATVALTGRSDAYYHDHSGSAQEFVSAAKYGYLFQGQRYDWQDASRGRPGLDLPARHFIHFLQNHDQIANSGTGQRAGWLASAARMRTMTALLLLSPQIPMLFQGQEFGASTPFFFFADHPDELGSLVRKGRLDFLRQFPNLQDEAFGTTMPDPAEPSTFQACKLDWSERERNHAQLALHSDLLALRRRTPAIAAASRSCPRTQVDGSVLGTSAFLLRYFTQDPEEERLLLFNLGKSLPVQSVADPLFAPPLDCQWFVEWSSEDFAYGGSGIRPADLQRRWVLDADSAIVFAPRKCERKSAPDGKSLRHWQKSVSCL